MTKRIRTIVNLEIQESVRVRRQREVVREWCAACSAVQLMITSEEAADLLRAAPRAIDHWLNTRKIHSVELLEGRIGICLPSLIAWTEDSNQSAPERPDCGRSDVGSD
jgi:hypothetical protein